MGPAGIPWPWPMLSSTLLAQHVQADPEPLPRLDGHAVPSADQAQQYVLRVAQFTALRYFALHGTDHASHKEQASMIRRYIIWRNNHPTHPRLRRVVDRATVA
jgi:hypothetical protein